MLFLAPDDLRLTTVDAILARRDMTLAFARGDVSGMPLAAALHCDWLALDADSRLILGSPSVWSGVFRRLGPRADRFHFLGRGALGAEEAVREGLADVLVAPGADPVEWLAGWIGARSTRALDAAAPLIRSRGGDVAERSMFSALFAVGEPQKGLTAFLAKRTAQWT